MLTTIEKKRWVPNNSVEHSVDTINAVWYTSEGHGFYYALGYSGKRNNHDFHYRFHTNQDRDEYITSWLKSLEDRHKMMSERAKARKSTIENPFKPGDIFHHSWGYDQTNCDYYQVVRVTKACVIIRRIGSLHVSGSGGFMSDMRMPDKDHFVKDAPELTKRVGIFKAGEYYLSFDFGSCRPFDGEPNYCSWYA